MTSDLSRRRGPSRRAAWRAEDIQEPGDDEPMLRRSDIVPPVMAVKEPYPGSFLSMPLSECAIEPDTFAILLRMRLRQVGDLRALSQASILLFMDRPRLGRMRTAIRTTFRNRHGGRPRARSRA